MTFTLYTLRLSHRFPGETEIRPLRIFYASDHTPNAEIPSSRLWYNNLFLPLTDLGHDLVPFDFDLAPYFKDLDPAYPEQKAVIDEIRPLLEKELLQQVTAAHKIKPIDVFFSYFYSRCARPAVIREIAAMGIRTVNFYANATHQFHLISELAPAYDVCIVPEKIRLEDYRRIGANPIYCQLGANPNIYRPFDLPQQYDVSFVGQNYGNRPHCIRHLLDHGIDARVWGWGWNGRKRGPLPDSLRTRPLKHLLHLVATLDGWRRTVRKAASLLADEPAPPLIPREKTGPPLSDDELIKLFSRSKISLGFSTVGDPFKKGERLYQTRLRDFEAPMSGAFYMVEDNDELKEFFEPDREVVYYRDKFELADKVKYYLSHDGKRNKIREAALRRARAEHTWHKRFESVFARLGL